MRGATNRRRTETDNPNFSELEELLRQCVTPIFAGGKVGEDDVVEDNELNDSQSVKPNES